MMKYLYFTALIFLVSCEQKNNAVDKNQPDKIETLTKTKEIPSAKSSALKDKTIKFLWRDDDGNILIDEEYCKTIPEPEKAALGHVATFIGNDCWWDGEYTDRHDNLKCKILTALDLGYQCSEKHLGFLRKWFRNDAKSLKEFESCPTTPNTATIQNTFDEITLTTKGNRISVFFEANGVNLREEDSWSWSETDYFEFENDNIKLIKKDESKASHEKIGMEE